VGPIREAILKASIKGGNYSPLHSDSISHEEKLTLAFSLMTKPQIVSCACDFAEEVLPIFEAKYPNDNRPCKAIAAARAWARGEGSEEELRAAADAAAASYAAAYASYAAASASYAAYAAHYAASAAY
jgi:hypothetical protein